MLQRVHHIRCWLRTDDPAGEVMAGKNDSESFILVEHIFALQLRFHPLLS